MSAPLIETRRVVHPGASRFGRVLTAVGEHSRQSLGSIHEGETIQVGVERLFAALGEVAGGFRLIGGRLDQAFYHVAKPRDDSPRAVEYGAPIQIEGGAAVVAASGSFGPSLSGKPLLHLHGALADDQGRGHGGHLNVEQCVAGPGGVRVHLMTGSGFRQAADPETRFSTFFPVSESHHEPVGHH
ncbi:PCC domain-containing protein [Brevundimonas sp.]|uniref:PCC domain-containing protein n=1 Tax=Brevundimonas sp. TaxID=1871086 RepID=UPI0037BFE941